LAEDSAIATNRQRSAARERGVVDRAATDMIIAKATPGTIRTCLIQ